MNDNASYILKRLSQAGLVIFLVSVLSFMMLKLSPGDCFTDVKLNPSTSKEFIDSEKARLGYDKPVFIQYANWLGSALRGNLGRTCQGNAPVLELVTERAGNTLILAIASLITTWAIAIPLGIFCAVKQNTRLDQSIQVLSYAVQGFPSFILAILVLMFAQSTSLFPVGGLTSIDFSDFNWFGKIVDIAYHLILPVFTLTIIGFVGLQRLMRGNLCPRSTQCYKSFDHTLRI
jgi:peptide/nickel transport system permease protein